MKPCLGIVVPSLTKGGGVPAVARFILEAARSSGHYDIRLVSLAMASRDPVSSSVLRPWAWSRLPGTSFGEWQGYPFRHVGAVWGELEFQRYRPRLPLKEALAGCQLIQVVCGSPAWACAVMGLGIPVSIQTATRAKVERRMRDARVRSPASLWRWGMTFITDRMDDAALRRADAVQVMNSWMLEHATRVRNDSDAGLRLTPPGVEADVFIPSTRREIGSDPYILCVGRLSDVRKNISLLLEAYALLPREVKARVRLMLAGQNGPPSTFWDRVRILGLENRVTFVPFPARGELVGLYQQAAVFALPSDEEGFGVVLLEAMACGIPVVSTRSGGPEGIITEGEEGYLVPRGDAPALAGRLLQLLEDPDLNRRMGGTGRSTVESLYSAPVAARGFCEIWEGLLARRG